MILQNVFQGRQFVLDLPLFTSYKEKQLLKEKITSNNGIISYTVTRKTDYLIRGTGNDDSSYRTRIAEKYGVKVITADYVDVCLAKGKLVDCKLYLVGGVNNDVKKQFADGKIVTIVEAMPKCRGTKLSLIKTWLYKDRDGPTFHTDPHAVVKSVVLKGKEKQLSYPFCVIEIHCNLKTESEENFRYCVFVHQGMFPVPSDVKQFGSKTCRFLKTSVDALNVFDQLYKLYSYPPYSMTCCKTFPSHASLGSDCFHAEDWLLASVLVEAKVAQFVADIWTEAVYVIESTLSAPLKNMQENQLVHAESLLLDISKALANNDDVLANTLSKEYYTVMPHRAVHSISSLGLLTSEYNLCQLVRDLLLLQESISLSDLNIIEQQYFSLHCDIQVLENGSSEYQEIASLILDSKEELKLSICKIFRVHRSCENLDFTYSLGNKKLLFHGTQAANVVGILSRGMLLSSVIFPQCTNIGCTGVLGAGLYFTNEFAAANKHALASKTNGKRLVLVNEVALGECYDTYSSNQQFTRPPDGCNSVHGVKRRKPDIASDFEYNEYVVYNSSQQRLKYVVEFCQPNDMPTVEERPPTVKPDVLHVDPCKILANARKDLTEEQTLSTFDLQHFLIKHNSDTMSTTVGLQTEYNEPIPLKSVHIRAKLIDLAAEVVIMQEYSNDTDATIEARYVFPLDDKAAVCGFEAFSNGQHFVGRIEEKEEAQKEYKEAVESGKRAYLMDEEAPEVFKVSIGNVQPHSIVLVKIRYVAELDLDGDLISFRLPGAVSPWQQVLGLKSHLQTSTKVVDVSGEQSVDTSVELFVEMPFDIKTLYSPTHPIQTKKTAANAVVTVDKNESLNNGFQLLIGLSEIHVPRMWVENHPDFNSSACMVTFYPEFVSDTKHGVEVILALDASNSMAGPAFSAAQQIAILCLHYLPPETKFNVLVFGSVYSELFPSTRQKSVEEMYEAQQFILQSLPTLGSSKITHFSQSYFHLKPPANTLRSIYIISDGHLQEIEPVLQNAANHNSHTRIFCLGVGTFVNTHLLNKLAHVGAGCYEYFDEKRKSKWASKAQGQMVKAEEPVLTDIKLEWQQFNESETEIIQAPKQITAVFSGSRLTVYGFVNNCSLAVLKGNVGGTEVSTMVFTTELGKSRGTTLHCLTTKALVRDWENGFLDQDRVFHETCRRSFQSKIIGLSKKYSIITPLTSFVAVEDKDNETATGYNGQPTIEEFVQAECIDFLQYLPFQEQSSEKSESPFGGGAMRHRKIIGLNGKTKSPVDEYYSEEGQDVLCLLNQNSRSFALNEEEDTTLQLHGTPAPSQLKRDRRSCVEKLCKKKTKNVEEYEDDDLLVIHKLPTSVPNVASSRQTVNKGRSGKEGDKNHTTVSEDRALDLSIEQQLKEKYSGRPLSSISTEYMPTTDTYLLQYEDDDDEDMGCGFFDIVTPSQLKKVPGSGDGVQQYKKGAEVGTAFAFASPTNLCSSVPSFFSARSSNISSDVKVLSEVWEEVRSSKNCKKQKYLCSPAPKQVKPSLGGYYACLPMMNAPQMLSDYAPPATIYSRSEKVLNRDTQSRGKPVSFNFKKSSNILKEDLTRERRQERLTSDSEVGGFIVDDDPHPQRSECYDSLGAAEPVLSARRSCPAPRRKEWRKSAPPIRSEKHEKKTCYPQASENTSFGYNVAQSHDYNVAGSHFMMKFAEVPILPSGSTPSKQTISRKDQFKVSSTSLGAGLPFFSSLFKQIICNIGLVSFPSVKEQIEAMLEWSTDELCFPVLKNCDSEGGIQLTNLPQGWNHELWSKIQFQLANNGLMSMGITVHNSILSLVATMAVLLDICQKISSKLFPLDLTNPSSIEEVVSKITEHFQGDQINFTTQLYFIKSILFITSFNQRHPLVYRTLELGNSWEEAVYLLTNGESLLEHDVQ